jgi:hypothetical protein
MVTKLRIARELFNAISLLPRLPVAQSRSDPVGASVEEHPWSPTAGILLPIVVAAETVVQATADMRRAACAGLRSLVGSVRRRHGCDRPPDDLIFVPGTLTDPARSAATGIESHCHRTDNACPLVPRTCLKLSEIYDACVGAGSPRQSDHKKFRVKKTIHIDITRNLV